VLADGAAQWPPLGFAAKDLLAALENRNDDEYPSCKKEV
jgi:hypothetical protein